MVIFIEAVGALVVISLFGLGIYHAVQWFQRRNSGEGNNGSSTNVHE